ncbi:Sec-independent protein translocase subunit TatA [Kitasatospora sp. NPDC096204]|uniref:Sec-independent protein translocase subunit TatA n=1 Tax=Kitasatospora sp. NPDC096204 TaxID=3364094 RepID=UPI00382CE41D
MLRNGLEPWHLLIVLAVVVLLFGTKKLPDMARGLGKSMRILRAETAAMREEDPPAAGAPAAGAPAAGAPAAGAPVTGASAPGAADPGADAPTGPVATPEAPRARRPHHRVEEGRRALGRADRVSRCGGSGRATL